MNDNEDLDVPMTWALIDDQSTFHAKVVKAGNSAWGACVRMITWSSGQLSDGVIPTHIASLIATEEELKALLGVGLLERSTEGFYIHDYLEWNRSAEEIKKQRAHLSEIRSKAGKKGGSAKAKNSKLNNNAVLANDVAKPLQNSVALSSPLLSNTNTKNEPGAHADLRSCFETEFSIARGIKPYWNAKEASACKRLLDMFGLEQSKSIVQEAFMEPWFVKNHANLLFIANNPNKYLNSAEPVVPIEYFKPSEMPLDRPDPEMVKEFFNQMQNMGKLTE